MAMNRTVHVLTLVGFLAIIGAGCQPRASAGLSEAEMAAIRQTNESFAKSANERAWADLAALYAEDAVLLPQNGEAVNGRAAIQEWFSAFPSFTDFKVETLEIEGRGDLAYVRGAYSMSMAPEEGGEPVADRGKYIEIHRRQPNGGWKISRDIYNSDMPISMPEPSPIASPEPKR
jgi:ketosteroid isomerase-like protein